MVAQSYGLQQDTTTHLLHSQCMGRPLRNPIQPGDGDPRHGTSNGYSNHGCRCPLCTEAHAVKHKQYMHNHPEQQEKHRSAQRERYRRHTQPETVDG